MSSYGVDLCCVKAAYFSWQLFRNHVSLIPAVIEQYRGGTCQNLFVLTKSYKRHEAIVIRTT